MPEMNLPELLSPDQWQMYAFGVLTLVLTWHGRLMMKVVNRALRSFDRMASAMDAIKTTLVKVELRLDRVEKRLGDREE